jgi:hypothetical protein
MGNAEHEGLKAAAEVFARVMRVVAAVRTDETAAAVNVAWEGEGVLIRGGRPGGAWGWEPIQALMFDNNKRHPLFGNKGHWYHQGYYPITEETVVLGIDEAVSAFADAAIPILLEEHGL